jgi:hypothetical protein
VLQPQYSGGASLSREVTQEKHERPFVVFAPSLVAQLHQQSLSPTSHKPVRTIFVIVGTPVGKDDHVPHLCNVLNGLVKTDVASGGLGDERTRSYVPTQEGFALDDARIGVAPSATRGVP